MYCRLLQPVLNSDTGSQRNSSYLTVSINSSSSFTCLQAWCLVPPFYPIVIVFCAFLRMLAILIAISKTKMQRTGGFSIKRVYEVQNWSVAYLDVHGYTPYVEDTMITKTLKSLENKHHFDGCCGLQFKNKSWESNGCWPQRTRVQEYLLYLGLHEFHRPMYKRLVPQTDITGRAEGDGVRSTDN